MKIIGLISIFVLLTFAAFGQSFYGGLVGGFSGSQIDGDTQGGYTKPGFVAGVYVGRDLGGNKAFKIELYYIGKGALKNVKYANGTVVQEFKTHLNYVEMPIFYVWNFSEKFTFSGGIASAFNFSSKLYYKGGLLPESTYEMSPFDFSPIVKVEFNFSERMTIGVRFSRSVFSIRTDDYLYNNNLSVA
ncbi:MAG: outer membrane beta-barrel protein, partial [Bacteroidota bacterium]|nr:outer membrane beta-barrel protein [Bacteroidota bacterium]